MDYKTTKVIDSKRVASAALKMALTETREEEDVLKMQLRDEGIAAAAVNFGGDAISSVSKIVERAPKERVLSTIPTPKRVPLPVPPTKRCSRLCPRPSVFPSEAKSALPNITTT